MKIAAPTAAALALAGCAYSQQPMTAATYDRPQQALAACFYREVQKTAASPITYSDVRGAGVIEIYQVLDAGVAGTTKAWQVDISSAGVGKSSAKITMLNTNLMKSVDIVPIEAALNSCGRP